MDDKSNGNINILITGDFCPGSNTEELCSAGMYREIFNDVIYELYEKDYSIVNLECPLTIESSPILKNGPNLFANPKCIEIIKYAKINAVSIANNHIMDQGISGLVSTIENCNKSGIATVGAGENLYNAKKILYLTINKVKVAIISIAENEFSIAGEFKAGACPIDFVINYEQILEARKNASVTLLIVHGGHEHSNLPSPRMVQLYRFYASLGVTAIVGHHTHCPSGYEVYRGTPIFYGLGNFIFDRLSSPYPDWCIGFFVKLTINRKVKKIKIVPYSQFRKKPGLFLLKGTEKEEFKNNIRRLSDIITDKERLIFEWEKFIEKNYLRYKSTIFGNTKIKQKLIRKNIFKNIFIRKKHVLSLLNIIRCESHRELLINTLERILEE